VTFGGSGVPPPVSIATTLKFVYVVVSLCVVVVKNVVKDVVVDKVVDVCVIVSLNVVVWCSCTTLGLISCPTNPAPMIKPMISKRAKRMRGRCRKGLPEGEGLKKDMLKKPGSPGPGLG
jgi:hypothetical protein